MATREEPEAGAGPEKRPRGDSEEGVEPSVLGDLTALLHRMGTGDDAAASQVYDRVYGVLRAMAHSRMRHQRPAHLLEATALVNEAYLRMVRRDAAGWTDRRHFFAVAATAMRCILADHARSMAAAMRTPLGSEVELEGLILSITPKETTYLEFDECLEKLSTTNKEAAEVVQLRIFAGLSIKEIASSTDRAPRTIERLWAYGKVRLKKDLLDERA